MAGLALARLGLGFEAILYSPKVRARQTAELAAEAWDADERSRLAVLRAWPAASTRAMRSMRWPVWARRAADAGRPRAGSLHVVAELTGARIDLKKGGLAVVKLEGGGGQLAVLMRPRELALIADPSLRGVAVPVGGE